MTLGSRQPGSTFRARGFARSRRVSRSSLSRSGAPGARRAGVASSAPTLQSARPPASARSRASPPHARATPASRVAVATSSAGPAPVSAARATRRLMKASRGADASSASDQRHVQTPAAPKAWSTSSRRLALAMPAPHSCAMRTSSEIVAATQPTKLAVAASSQRPDPSRAA